VNTAVMVKPGLRRSVRRPSCVLQKGINPGKSALLALGLSCLLCAAETEEGLAAGFLGCQPGADPVVGMECDVRFEFGREVVVGTAAVE
jgi:hypothetical protein